MSRKSAREPKNYPYQDGLLGLKIPIMNPIKGLLRDYRV